MVRDWERIRARRQDITDWVIHQTRRGKLPQILRCGYLKPPLAAKLSQTMGGKRDTIHGPHPAACFTDQPLWAFIKSCEALPNRYSPYGIALSKRNLYIDGGRPVIYGDKQQLDRLHDDDKYLWVHYDPVQNPLYGNYPMDWTHEREWRARVKRYSSRDWGPTSDEGVPLVLPPEYVNGELVISLPQILVRTLEDVAKLRKLLGKLPEYKGANGFIRQLYAHFAELKIIALDFVSEQLKAGRDKWARLDTLPSDEIPQ